MNTIDKRRTIASWWVWHHLQKGEPFTNIQGIYRLIAYAEEYLKECDAQLALIYEEYTPQF